MTSESKIAIERDYDAMFGNGLDDLAIDELSYKDSFWMLVKGATERGTPLTFNEVAAAFPGTSWEE